MQGRFQFVRSTSISMAAAVGATGGIASAAVFAERVVLDQTSGLVAPHNNAGAATGAPHGLTGEGGAFQTILSPFNPAYEQQHVTKIGAGGQLTLQLERYALPGAGLELGVVSNNFLIDSDYPNGQNADPAQVFGSDTPGGGTAEVRVSEDGQSWQSLGTFVFDMPANYYADAASPQQGTPGSDPADFGIPFDHDLSDFDGLDWQETRALFGDAGGGTWIDLSSAGLTRVGFVQFLVPDGKQLVIDSVAIGNDAVGDPVPEPAMAGSALAGVFVIARRRRLRTRR